MPDKRANKTKMKVYENSLAALPQWSEAPQTRRQPARRSRAEAPADLEYIPAGRSVVSSDISREVVERLIGLLKE